MSSRANADSLTVLTEIRGQRLAKRHVFSHYGWVSEGFPANAKYFTFDEKPVSGVDELFQTIKEAAKFPAKMVIRAVPGEGARAAVAEGGRTRRTKAHFDATPRRWVCFDIDAIELPGFDIRHEPEAMIRALIATHFPSEFQNVRLAWQLSSSAGIKAPQIVKVHLWAWLSRPLGAAELKAWKAQSSFPADPALFNDVQAHYIADPAFVGAPDPCLAGRWGILGGEQGEVIVPPIDLSIRPNGFGGGHYGGAVGGGSVEAILAKMGDGVGLDGFHKVILGAQMHWARTTPPALQKAEREALKASIRYAARRAPRAKVRSAEDVEAYLSDRVLDSGIDGAVRRIGSSRFADAAVDFAPMVSLAEAERVLREDVIGYFFDKVLA